MPCFNEKWQHKGGLITPEFRGAMGILFMDKTP